MDTLQLRESLKILTSKMKKCYTNCVASDELDSLNVRHLPACIITNDMPRDHPGRHWLGIFIPRIGPAKFFCSYGMGLNNYDEAIANFMMGFGREIIENTKRLQSYNTKVCGQYALYFLYQQLYGCCNMSIYCRFSEKTRFNDKNVAKFFNNISKINRKRNNVNYKTQCCSHFVK